MVSGERCSWCGEDALYVEYHDNEWGMPQWDSRALFELLVLEGMQAGLSWYMVLKKRDRMRERFLLFDPDRLAAAGEKCVALWLRDPGIIRHRGKLEAMIANARAYQQMDDFAGFIWSFVGGEPRQNRWRVIHDVPAATAESQEMARELKRHSFRFVGPTTCYAFMQSTGLVNDHLVTCPAYQRCYERATEAGVR